MPVDLAIVGCGGMARRFHLNAYFHIMRTVPEKLDLVAFCDPARERAEEFACEVYSAFGMRPATYDDIETMLAREDLDGVDVCTPHGLHHIHAAQCLEAGAHVMVEKPLAVTIRAAQHIVDVAKRTGKIAATGEQIRRLPSRRAARWLIHEKQMLGDMRQFFAQHASFQAPNDAEPWTWRSDPMLGGGGLALDAGAHYCDIMRFLFGDPETIFAHVSQLEDRKLTKDGQVVPRSDEDTWVATLLFKSGVTGLWSCTTSAPGMTAPLIVNYWTEGYDPGALDVVPRPLHHAVYSGSEGALVDGGDVFHGPFDSAMVVMKDGTRIPMSVIRKEYLASLSDEDRERLFPHGFEEGVLLECWDFADAIEKNRPPELTAEHGLRSLAITMAMYESSALGQAVSFDDVVSGEVRAWQTPLDEHWGLT